MAKSTVAASAKTAEELKSEMRRLVKAIVDDDDVKAETFDEASRALSSLRDLKVNSNNCNGNRKKNGVIQPVPIPEHFLCPISSEIMRDPVVLSSGQVIFLRSFLLGEFLMGGSLIIIDVSLIRF